MLHNKSFTDVTFIVGPPHASKKYVGHRVLLAMTSPVFEQVRERERESLKNLILFTLYFN